MKLVSYNLGGNIHEAVEWINKYRLVDYFVQVDCISGQNSIVVLRVPDDFELKSHVGRVLNPRRRKS